MAYSANGIMILHGNKVSDASWQPLAADLVLPQSTHYMLGLTVQDLKQLRENWNDIAEFEYHRLRETSIQESIQQWLQLQKAFEWQLQQTEKLFAEQRRKALADLQARLHRLIE